MKKKFRPARKRKRKFPNFFDCFCGTRFSRAEGRCPVCGTKMGYLMKHKDDARVS